MKPETLTVEAALARGKELPWALVRSLSSVTLGPVPAELPPEDELLEVHFFSEAEEIRLFRDGAGLRAARLAEGPETPVIRREFEVENPAMGKTITVCWRIEADEDGQCALTGARLAGWEAKA